MHCKKYWWMEKGAKLPSDTPSSDSEKGDLQDTDDNQGRPPSPPAEEALLSTTGGDASRPALSETSALSFEEQVLIGFGLLDNDATGHTAQLSSPAAQIHAGSSSQAGASKQQLQDFAERAVTPPVEQQGDSSPQAGTARPRSSAKPDPTEFAPFDYRILEEGDKGYGEYYATVIFMSSPCPEELRYSDDPLPEDDDAWQEDKEHEPRTKVDGNPSRKKHRSSGYHLVKRRAQRLCTAEKYYLWRTITLRQQAKKDVRKPHEVYLCEGEPCGHSSEPAHWADKIKALNIMLRQFSPGSGLRILVDCTVNPSLLKGRYREWYQALLDLQSKWPKQVLVLVDEGSENVLEANASDHYPQEPSDYRDLAIQRHSIELKESEKDDKITRQEIEGMIAKFAEIERTKYRTSCQMIADNIEFCREFIRTVRSHQKRFESGELENTGTDQSEEASARAETSVAASEKLTAKGKGKAEAPAGESIDTPKQKKTFKRKSSGDEEKGEGTLSSEEQGLKKRKKADEGKEQDSSSKKQGKRPMR